MYVYGELLDGVETLSASDARLLVWIARHGRLSRVHRNGRPGRRGWTLEPRNIEERPKKRGLLK